MTDNYEGIILGGEREGEAFTSRSPVLYVDSVSLPEAQAPDAEVAISHAREAYRYRTMASKAGEDVTRRGFWVHESIPDASWMVYLVDRFVEMSGQLRIYENMEDIVYDLNKQLNRAEDAAAALGMESPPSLSESLRGVRYMLSILLREARKS